MKKKKILYLQHVDWNWIKQRPQYLAENLAKQNEVLVIYKFSFIRKGLQKRGLTVSNKNLMVKRIFRLPTINFLAFERRVNVKIMKLSVNYYIKTYKPDYIYLTSPEQINMLPRINKCPIIYDCMDNHIAFSNDKKEKKYLSDCEKQLVNVSNFILASSNKLIDHLVKSYGTEIHSKISLVRNGYDGKILPVCEYKNEKKGLTLVYVGTVGAWFDNELLLKSLEEFPQLHYEIIGPVALDAKKIVHERVKYLGTVEHHDLPNVIKNADCFIMPFQVNELVEAVDPVKFYEYINYNRNIISVYYDEIKRFEPFVEFYNDYEEYSEIIKKLEKDNKVKYSQSRRLEFLECNKWDNRADIINNLLE